MRVVKTAAYKNLLDKQAQKYQKHPTKKVPAQHLRPGDLVPNPYGMFQEVIGKPEAGLKTPRGKIEVTLRNPHTGETRVALWNKNTNISVVDREPQNQEKDICPNCGSEGGEYTDTLGECANCSSQGIA